MKMKRIFPLFFFAIFILAAGDFVGCSFMGGNHLFRQSSQPLSSEHPYRMAKVYQKQHEDYLEKAIQHYRNALKDPETADLARSELGRLFYKKGDFEKAIEHLESLNRGARDNFMISKVLGLSYFRLHQYAQALQYLKRAQGLNSEDAEVLCFLGRLYEEENFAEEAKECFRYVIKLSPRTCWAEQAKAHLEALQTGDSGATISQIENEEVRQLISEAPGQKDYPDAVAIVLLDQGKLVIHAGKTQTREIHKIIKILNDRGKHRAEAKIHYNSLDETVHVDLARTIRPDGRIVNVGREAMRDLTPWGGFPLYSNAKVRVISMPEVEDGAIIEYKATVRSARLPFDDYFTDYFGFQNSEPTIVSRYILEVPEGLHFKTHFLHTDPIQAHIERISTLDSSDGGSAGAGPTDLDHRKESLLRYTWEMKDVPAIKWEPRMPGWVDISPMVLVSSFPDWMAFNRWLRELARDRIKADGAIREKVVELTLVQKTSEEKARAIFHYVTSEIRYVGLEYGRGGYRPHHAGDVFANKYGDCKDQTILLVAMLREMGIPAYPVLIGTRRGMWELQRSIPMPQFDHVIAMAEIDGNEIWLDPTDETCSFGDLPGGDQGREVLVFFEDGARFLRTPVLPPEKNKSINEIEIEIGANGAINVKRKDTFRGWVDRAMRNVLKWRDPQERIDLIKELVSKDCPGAILESCSFSPLEDLSVSLAVEYQVSVPDYVKRAGDLLLFRVPWLSGGAHHVAKEERIHPLNWNNTYSDEERISIQIPEGYRVRYMPESFEIDLPFASYRLEYASSGGKIFLRTLRNRMVRTIGIDQYPAYKKCEEKIARELRKLIILEQIENSPDIALTDCPGARVSQHPLRLLVHNEPAGTAFAPTVAVTIKQEKG